MRASSSAFLSNLARERQIAYNVRLSKREAAVAKKKKARASKKLDTKELKQGLAGVNAKLRELTERDPKREIGEDDVEMAKDIATELQEINRAFREALKRAMMADGKIKPGQSIKAGGKMVSLKPRPGCKEASTDPDDYDLIYEPIN
jgi:hypothetical protein